jgi:hypothetical protein
MFELNMNHLVGEVNVLFLTFDSLRFDVASNAMDSRKTPALEQLLDDRKWQRRDAPGTFTLPSHVSLFHGFFPTLPGTMRTWRPLSLAFQGSTTANENTYVFHAENIIAGFQMLHYRTFCIGGVGFFNRMNPMGLFLPGYFNESYWDESVGVGAINSAEAQVSIAVTWLKTLRANEKFLLFINVSATHVPHGHYLNSNEQTTASQEAALAAVDRVLPKLVKEITQHGDCLCFWMSDHGDAYGEDGLYGHRFAHPVVAAIPYAAFVLSEHFSFG